MRADRNFRSTCFAIDGKLGMSEAIVVLASQSPNRLKLLKQIGLKNVIVKVSNFEENLPKTLPLKEFVVETARGKLLTTIDEMNKTKRFWDKYSKDRISGIQEPYDVIVACDTVIEFEGEIIGKPENAYDAVETLRKLRNNRHNVYTGMVLQYQKTGEIEDYCDKTVVQFGDIPDSIIKRYVDSGEPLNKAGSYGIGDFGAVFVDRIEGSMPNVVGLPVHLLFKSLVSKNIF